MRQLLAIIALLLLPLSAEAYTATKYVIFSGETGLTGSVGYTIYNSAGTAVVSRTIIGVSEIASRNGLYIAAITPPDSNQDIIVWDDGSSHYAIDKITPTDSLVSTALPNAAPAASGGLPTVGTGSGQISPLSGTFTGVGLAPTQTGVTIPTVTSITNSVTISGTVSANVTQIAGQTASAAAGVTFPSSIGTSTYSGGAVASVIGAVGSVISPVTVGTNNDKTGYSLTTAPPTTSQIAAVILKTPTNLLATDSSGDVTFNNATIGVSGYSSNESPDYLVWNALLATYNTSNSFGYAIQHITGGSGGGGGIVTGYATGQDPATLLLANPGNKLYTSSSGAVQTVPSTSVGAH